MDKERVTINISKKLLRRLDFLIDKKLMKNRSNAIENILNNHFYHRLIKEAVFFIGGNDNVSKDYGLPFALMPYKGKTVFEHKIEFMKDYNIDTIIVAGGSLNDKIKEMFGNGSRLGIKLVYVEENEALGTAGVLMKCKPYVSGRFVALNLTNVSEFDLGDVIDYHKQNKPVGTIVVKSVSNPKVFGSVEIDGNVIVDFKEKDKDTKSNIANAGTYIFELEIFRYIKNLKKKKVFLESDIFPMLAEKREIIAYHINSDWFSLRDTKFYEKLREEGIEE